MGRSRLSKEQMNRAQRITTRALLGGVLAALALVLSTGAENDKQVETQKKEVFPRPTGPYAVGTHEYLWVDQKREEPFTKDPSDRRHLLARVWYPAETVTGKEPALYVLDVNEYPEKSIYRNGQDFKTNSVTDAPLAPNKRPFPVGAFTR